jgi:hypothetical protein
MNFREIISKVAPVAGALIGSPLAGMAISVIGEAIGMEKPTVERVASAIQSGSLSPEQFVAVKTADAALKVRLRELDIDEKKIEAETERAYLADTQDARKAHAGDSGVFWLGIAVLGTYALILGASLFGAYWLLVEGNLAAMDVGTVAAVFTLIGTIVGYIASDAKQVVAYYFGSSRGSNEKTRDMADAIKALGAG